MGSLFKSQNSRTWTSVQDEDLMFVLNKCSFNTIGGTVYLKESKKHLNKDLLEEEIASLDNEGTQHFLHSNTYIDAFEVQSDAIELNNTTLDYYYKTRSNSTGQMDSTYTAFVIFGNNRAGLIPSTGSIIEVLYRQGGGTVGNIVSGTIEKQALISVPGIPYGIPVIMSNYTKGEYGYDGDTIEDIRLKLPAWVRTQNRAVTGLDYKILTDQFATPYQGQIGKSTVVLRNSGCAGNIVDIYVLARNGLDGLNEASNELKVELERYLNNLKMITDFICIRNGSVISVDITIDVTMDRLYRKFEEEFKVKIQRRLDQFFAIANWEYGENLRDIDITKVLSDLKEITNIDITFTTDNPNNGGNLVTTKFYEIIRPDVVTVGFTFE